ncbi:MAG: hypothetical protein PGN26_14615 [Xylophilus ampelinus]
MATTIPPITALPPPPSTSNPATFDQLADPFVQALQGLSTELGAFRTAANTLGGEVETNAGAAQQAASTAINAPGTASTSTTSNTISLGSKTFTVQTGKAWAVGQVVNIARTSNPATSRMQAVITSYNSGNGALVVSVIAGTILGGGGTHTDWTITLSGSAVPMMVVDRAYNEQSGINVLAATIPYDNTTPQSNEGTLYHQASITPKSTTNRIRVRAQCPFGSSWQGADAGTLAIFVSGETSARWAVTQLIPDGGIGMLFCEVEYVPGSTAAQSVAVRIGCNAGSIIPNGNRFSIDLGGKMKSTLVLEEITA